MLSTGNHLVNLLQYLLRLLRVSRQFELQQRRSSNEVAGAARVLNAGQLKDDTARTFLLDGRLGDAELVNSVAQDFQGTVDGASP